MKVHQTPVHHPLQGMLLALAGFATFSVGDGIVKSMANQIPGTEVAMLRYFVGSIGLGIALLSVRGRAAFTCPRPALQFARATAVSFASLGFFIGVQFMPLANATAIQFTSPMLAALLSAVILKERASFAVWIASALAFVGVVIILRPQLVSVGSMAFYPLGAALGMACLMIFNRMAAGLTPLLESQFLISICALPILISIGFILHFSGLTRFHLFVPTAGVALKCVGVAITGTASHWLIFMATQRASAALIAPMMYVQLLVATAIGATFFHALPTPMTLVGAAIIVIGGLYLAHATRRASLKAITV